MLRVRVRVRARLKLRVRVRGRVRARARARARVRVRPRCTWPDLPARGKAEHDDRCPARLRRTLLARFGRRATDRVTGARPARAGAAASAPG